MGSTKSSRLVRINWLANGPLAHYIEAYKQSLARAARTGVDLFSVSKVPDWNQALA